MNGAALKYLLQTGMAGAALALAPGNAHSQTVSGETQAAVVTPLSFIQVEDLNFGQVMSGTSAGTVTISPTNVRSATGGALPVGNSHQAGKFVGRGTQNQRITVQIAPTVITLLGPGVPMTVTNLTIGTDGTLNQSGASRNYRIVPANGIFWFNVGGRLNINSNQAAGNYSGTFNATLIYE